MIHEIIIELFIFVLGLNRLY